MKKNIKNILKKVICAIIILACIVSSNIGISAWADDEGAMGTISTLAMSPMVSKIILNPGESYTGSFDLTVPATANSATQYEITLRNFYRDDDGNAVFEDINDTGRILDWTTIDSPSTGTIEPNSSKTIYYTINVPENAPGGGQYLMLNAATASNTGDETGEDRAVIQEKLALGHIVYAEITGNTIHQGEILSAEMPSFIFDGDIMASSTIKNTGNSHGTASYKMQIYPLFSDEEIYTNEEDPETHIILPGLTFNNQSYWDNTPDVGIFNVVYTVEFEGETTQVSKMVIKCPIWLLFIIIFIIAVIIIWLVMKARSRKKAKKSQPQAN